MRRSWDGHLGFNDRPPPGQIRARALSLKPRMRTGPVQSFAEAYELISQFKQISSNFGAVHSIEHSPFRGRR